MLPNKGGVSLLCHIFQAKLYFEFNAMLLKFKTFLNWTVCLITICFLCLASKCKENKTGTSPKITFDLNQIGDDGLSLKPDSKVAFDYEYCIPADEKIKAEIKRIDPSLKVMPHSRGRIGCSKSQWLCMGNTHQKNWRKILMQLAELDDIDRIDQAFFE